MEGDMELVYRIEDEGPVLFDGDTDERLPGVEGVTLKQKAGKRATLTVELSGVRVEQAPTLLDGAGTLPMDGKSAAAGEGLEVSTESTTGTAVDNGVLPDADERDAQAARAGADLGPATAEPKRCRYCRYDDAGAVVKLCKRHRPGNGDGGGPVAA